MRYLDRRPHTPRPLAASVVQSIQYQARYDAWALRVFDTCLTCGTVCTVVALVLVVLS